jgi:[calcium/calmodulin-dependent protein kinase] kinase
MAPELFSGPGDSRPSIDIWSMGVVLYTLYYGELPFNGKTENDIVNAITHKKLTLNPDRAMTNELKELMIGILQKDPEKRMKMAEIRFHKWFELE